MVILMVNFKKWKILINNLIFYINPSLRTRTRVLSKIKNITSSHLMSCRQVFSLRTIILLSMLKLIWTNLCAYNFWWIWKISPILMRNFLNVFSGIRRQCSGHQTDVVRVHSSRLLCKKFGLNKYATVITWLILLYFSIHITHPAIRVCFLWLAILGSEFRSYAMWYWLFRVFGQKLKLREIMRAKLCVVFI